MKNFALISALGLLAACAEGPLPVTAPADPAPELQVDTTREDARMVITPAVEEAAPGPASSVMTNCIIQTASSSELQTIAADAGGATSASTLNLISDILARPETVSCATDGMQS